MRTTHVACGVFACLLAATVVHGEIQMKVIPSLAPNVYGSPSWNGYVANAMYALEHSLDSYGDPTKPTYYQATPNIFANQGLVTSFTSWMGEADPTGDFAAELGNRMHFGLRIVATNGETFNLEQLSYHETSTDPWTVADPANGLTVSWPAGDWTYSSTRIGLIHNPDNTITRLDSGEDGGMAVDELLYVGAGDAFWPGDPSNWTCTGCTHEEKQGYIDEAARALGSYTYTGTYELEAHDVSGSGSFQVAGVPEPSTVTLLASMLGLAGLALRSRLARRG